MLKTTFTLLKNPQLGPGSAGKVHPRSIQRPLGTACRLGLVSAAASFTHRSGTWAGCWGSSGISLCLYMASSHGLPSM